MSRSGFKQFYLNQILDFLWRQWSALGVAGGGRSEDMWLIDPEPTLIFSIAMARYEPRLFDEILDWLVINGRWIDGQRIRTLAKSENEETKRLLSAVSSYVSHESPVYKRKWGSLALMYKAGQDTRQTTLFLTKDGKEYPVYRLEVSSASHPFYTGNEKSLDTAGRAEKFKARVAKAKSSKK